MVWWILQRGDQVAGGAGGVVTAARWLVRAALQVRLRKRLVLYQQCVLLQHGVVAAARWLV
jgi:hypothetical protein